MESVRGLVCDSGGVGNAAMWAMLLPTILGVASIVAKMTPTKADNKVLDFAVKIIHAFGLTKAAAKK